MKKAFGIIIGLMLSALLFTSCPDDGGGGSSVDTNLRITSVNVNVTPPRKDATPAGYATTSDGGYSVTDLNWSPVASPAFSGGTQYTVTVKLTADSGSTFKGLANDDVKVNSFKATTVSNSSSSLTLTYKFPPTLDKDVDSLSVTAQPDKLEYTLGDSLDLTGLKVKITYDDATTDEVTFGEVLDGYDAFQNFGMDTEPRHGATASMAENNIGVRVFYGNKEAYTAKLTVDIPEEEQAYPEGYPKTMNMANPLFHQFESETVDWIGKIVPGVMGPLHTADASARVWTIDGVETLFVYASHDMLEAAGCARMDRYHVFSTTDMKNWTDYGEIVKADDVPWHTGNFENGSKFMWAPDCVYKDGLYYFYFPHPTENISDSWGSNWQIGIAVSRYPASNFMILPTYLKGLGNGAQNQIDPAIFIDDDGQAYFYNGGGGRCYGGKLKDNMIEIDGNMQQMAGLDNFHEGTWVHKRNGVYYLSYSDNGGGGASNGDQLKYATSSSPLGPWTYKGAYVYATGNGTNHGSIVEFKNKWYAFYHSDYVSYVGNDQGRSVHVDELKYDFNGDILLVNTFGKPYNGPHTVVNTNGDPELVALDLKAVDFNGAPDGFNEISGVNDGGRTYGYLSRHIKPGGDTVNNTYRKTVGMVIESEGGDYVLGTLANREFVRYTINVDGKGGRFQVKTNVSGAGTFYLAVNGVNSSGILTITNTNGVFKTINTDVQLKSGENLFELRVLTGGFKVKNFEFISNIIPLELELVDNPADKMAKRLKLTGMVTGPLKGEITLKDSSIYSFVPVRFEGLVEDGELLIDLPYYSGYILNFEITLDGGRKFTYPLRFDKTFADKYDDENSLDKGVTPFIIAETKECISKSELDRIEWGGLSDCSLKGNAKWDNNNLYLYLVITDDVHYSNDFGNQDTVGIWMGDAIQIMINMDKGGAAGGETNSNELGFALHDSPNVNVPVLSHRWRAPTGATEGAFKPGTGTTWQNLFKITRDNTAKTTTYDLTIPWASLKGTQAMDLKKLGISILICDSDLSGRSARLALEYGVGINTSKDPANTTDFYLMDDGEFEELLETSAEAAVVKAETNAANKTYHDIARNFVNLVIDPAKKSALESRLDALGL
jgi:hypothetical protein